MGVDRINTEIDRHLADLAEGFLIGLHVLGAGKAFRDLPTTRTHALGEIDHRLHGFIEGDLLGSRVGFLGEDFQWHQDRTVGAVELLEHGPLLDAGAGEHGPRTFDIAHVAPEGDVPVLALGELVEEFLRDESSLPAGFQQGEREVVHHLRGFLEFGRAELANDALVDGAGLRRGRTRGATVVGRLALATHTGGHIIELCNLLATAGQPLAHLSDFFLEHPDFDIAPRHFLGEPFDRAHGLALLTFEVLHLPPATGRHGSVVLGDGVLGCGIGDLLGQGIHLTSFSDVRQHAIKPLLDVLETGFCRAEHSPAVGQHRVRAREGILPAIEGCRIPLHAFRKQGPGIGELRKRVVVLLDGCLLLVEAVVLCQGADAHKVLVEVLVPLHVELAVAERLFERGLERRADDLPGFQVRDALVQPHPATGEGSREHAQALVEVVAHLDRDRTAIRIANTVRIGGLQEVLHALGSRVEAVDRTFISG